MSVDRWSLVSIPRRFVDDRILETVIALFGHSWPSRRPLKWILFHDLTRMERLELGYCPNMTTWKEKVEEIRSRLLI
jgi:hypothetical protein